METAVLQIACKLQMCTWGNVQIAKCAQVVGPPLVSGRLAGRTCAPASPLHVPFHLAGATTSIISNGL